VELLENIHQGKKTNVALPLTFPGKFDEVENGTPTSDVMINAGDLLHFPPEHFVRYVFYIYIIKERPWDICKKFCSRLDAAACLEQHFFTSYASRTMSFFFLV
jgi:hypothetical protein